MTGADSNPVPRPAIAALPGVLGVVIGLGAIIGQDVIMKNLSAHYSVLDSTLVWGAYSASCSGARCRPGRRSSARR